MKSYFIILLLLVSSFIFGQYTVKGRVIDEKSGEALAFVNIVYNNNKQGTTSGIDGFFTVKSKTKPDYLEFSFLGYKTKRIEFNDIKTSGKLIVKLEPVAYNIDEVVVFPTENPAHRIINLVIKNKKINNPDNLPEYTYHSYNKMIFTFDMNILDTQNSLDTSLTNDSSYKELKKLHDTQYLMMMESVSERKYKSGKLNEKVLASRVSGFKNPMLTVLATQLQSLSFYNDYINILDKNYLSPISNNSTKKYFFLIEDTLYDNNNDTIFVISFRPRKNKNFDGLKGVLNINTNKYAVQSVKAEPYEQDNSLQVKINQKYKFIQNKQWFPVQLNTSLFFKNLGVSTGNDSNDFEIIGIGKSYIKDINLNPGLKSRNFDHIAFEIDEKAGKRDSVFWLQYRDSLNSKERKTYQVIDSLGEEYNFDKKLNTYTYILSGKIPVKFMNIDLDKLINYNIFEGFQLGFGMSSNERLSKIVSTGGYFRYGFTDKHWKYGGNLKFNISAKHQTSAKISYFNETSESSGYGYLEKNPGIFSGVTDGFRSFLISDMYYTEGLKFDFTHRIFSYLKFNIYAKYSNDIVANNYYYSKQTAGDGIVLENMLTNYEIHEAGVKLKYLYGEQFAKMGNKLISLGSKYPALFFNFIHGFTDYGGSFEYNKYEAKFIKNFMIRNLGRSYICITAGYTNDELPYIYLYNGHGSYTDFGIETAFSFGTMRMNEFLSDEFVNLFLRHDFKSLLFKSKHFQPKLGIVTSFGYGRLKHNSGHNNIEYKTMEKGYAESGILINNIFKQNFSSLGIGVYYRWGAYKFDNEFDNFAFKLSSYYTL